MQSIAWYKNRLVQMSPPELFYRAKKTMLNHAQRMNFFTAKKTSFPDLNNSSAICFKSTPNVDVKRYTQAADLVIRGHYQIFALDNVNLDVIPRWNRDPITGREAPLTFGKWLDYRDEKIVGNIKYLWEPNRHLQLVVLAQAFKLTGNETYLQALKIHLSSWFEQCPYLQGPNWASSLELGIRLINWSLIWQLIGELDCSLFKESGGVSFRDRWLRSIFQHCHFIAGHLSRFSSANNHLIGEAAGLFIAGSTWPYWRDMDHWRDLGYQTLIQECLLQNYADGVNKEQAVSYQQFVLDFLLVASLAGRGQGIEFPKNYWDRIEAMLEYLASIMDVRGHVPMIGDADDGYVVRLSPENDFCPYRSLLATGAILFNRSDFKRKAKKIDDKTQWLLGSDAVRAFAAIDDSSALLLPVRRSFPEGGYYILGSDFETEEEIRLIADAGPLGYLSLAAHGHADALAVILNVGGREFLVDPGTYVYHTAKEWRDYFRGTAAHNTVRVDGENQSVIGGNFMWMKHARATCGLWKSTQDMDEFSGLHDGYSRLDDPVLHHRNILLMKRERKILIEDIFNCRNVHTIERFWHFSELCQVSIDGPKIYAENGGIRVYLTAVESTLKVEERRANENPLGGWVSRGFDRKNPSTSVVWKTEIDGYSRLQTEITCFA